MANTPNDEPGNDARHTGDRLGFPHAVADGKSLDDAHTDDISEGALVTWDGTANGGDGAVVEATASSDAVVGVLYTLPVEGQSRRGGPYVRGDRDATIAVRGQYTADLSGLGASVGDYVDDAGNVFVKHNIEGDVYEVMVR